MTASKVPGGAEGCFGSICNLTRPFVAFSTFCAHTASTSLVNECDGGTQLDIVMVVCAWAAIDQQANTAKLDGDNGVLPETYIETHIPSSQTPDVTALSGHQLGCSVKVFCGGRGKAACAAATGAATRPLPSGSSPPGGRALQVWHISP